MWYVSPATPETLVPQGLRIQRCQSAVKVDKAAFGLWPFNYLLLANELDLDYDLTPSANVPITRADMAIAAKNALLSDSKWDTEHEELYSPPAGHEGDYSLLVRVFDYDNPDFAAMKEGLPGSVAGKITSVLATSTRVILGGKEYRWASPTITFVCNTAAVSAHPYDNTVEGLTELMTDGRIVTAAITDAGKIWKVSWTQNRADQLITGVTVLAGETAYGTVTLAGKVVNVDPVGVEVWVNGEKRTLAALKSALAALQGVFTGAPAAATVRTVGDASIAANNVYYIYARTDGLLSGVVSSLGSDAVGHYFRITVGSVSQKHYYASGVPVRVGPTKKAFLLSPTDMVVAQLTPVTVPVTVFWARVLEVEKTVPGHLYTVNTNAGAFLGEAVLVGGIPVYDQTEIASDVVPSTVAAIKLDPVGTVDLIEDKADFASHPTLYVDTDAPTSRLHYADGVTNSVALVSGMYAITKASSTEGVGVAVTVLATADTLLINGATGALSAYTLTDLRANPTWVGDVYYVEKGGLRSAQIIIVSIP